MSALAPAKKKRAPAKSALRNAELLVACGVFWFLQPRKAAMRRCAACNSRVTNRNLGGNDGRSALTGTVWCLRCADYPQQRLLALGGTP